MGDKTTRDFNPLEDRLTLIRNVAVIVDPGNCVRIKQDPERAGVGLKGKKDAAGTQMVAMRFADRQGAS